MATDYKPDDLLKDSAITMEKATRRVWEMKHFVRQQLLSINEDRMVRNLEADDEIKNLHKVIPYRTRGGMTSYARKLHGDKARQPKRRNTLQVGAAGSDMMGEEEAAMIIQTRARSALAKNRMLVQVSLNYQKVSYEPYSSIYLLNLLTRTHISVSTGVELEIHAVLLC